MKKTATRSSISPLNVRTRRGFTLVELLVVIVIIAVLASIAVVATGKIRARAQEANAMSSLRQVSIASMAYSAEKNGDINTLRWVGDPKEGVGGYVRNSFWGRLQPYLFQDATATNQPQLKRDLSMRLDQLFNSPDADTMASTPISGARIYHDGSGLAVPIAFNSNLHKWNEFIKVSSFRDPSQVLYATYGFGFFNKEHGQTYVETLRDGTNTKNSSNIYYLDNRQAIVIFLDGHMDMISPPIPDRNFE